LKSFEAIEVFIKRAIYSKHINMNK